MTLYSCHYLNQGNKTALKPGVARGIEGERHTSYHPLPGIHISLPQLDMNIHLYALSCPLRMLQPRHWDVMAYGFWCEPNRLFFFLIIHPLLTLHSKSAFLLCCVQCFLFIHKIKKTFGFPCLCAKACVSRNNSPSSGNIYSPYIVLCVRDVGSTSLISRRTQSSGKTMGTGFDRNAENRNSTQTWSKEGFRG